MDDAKTSVPFQRNQAQPTKYKNFNEALLWQFLKRKNLAQEAK